MTATAYVTDVEGMWEKLASFCRGNPLVSLDASGLRVREGARFVFGGDAIDRGPHGRRILETLLAAKRRQPDQVVLLAGNRDLNKLRLVRELCGFPQAKCPPDVRAGSPAAILRWTFERTMNARGAFEHRRSELLELGRPADDDAVVASFLEDLEPAGLLTEYLLACQLAFEDAGTLFVHGNVTEDNLGVVPGAGRTADVRAWIDELNAWYRGQLEAFAAGDRAVPGEPPWQPVVRYQAPSPGQSVNPESVVYSRPTDALGNPVLPPASLIATLAAQGIDRVVVGHTPTGDSPAVLREGRFELVLADNSYGRVERGSRVTLARDETRVEGAAVLEDGRPVAVTFSVPREDAGVIGRRADEHLVKGRLDTGELLLFRALPGYRFEQLACDPGEVTRRRITPAR